MKQSCSPVCRVRVQAGAKTRSRLTAAVTATGMDSQRPLYGRDTAIPRAEPARSGPLMRSSSA